MERTDSKHSVCTRHSNGDNSDHSSDGFLWTLWFCEAKHGQVPVFLGLWTIHRRFFLSIIRVSLLLLGSSHHHCHQLDLLLHNWFLFMQTLAPDEKYPVKLWWWNNKTVLDCTEALHYHGHPMDWRHYFFLVEIWIWVPAHICHQALSWYHQFTDRHFDFHGSGWIQTIYQKDQGENWTELHQEHFTEFKKIWI